MTDNFDSDDNLVRGPLPGLSMVVGDVADDLPQRAANRFRGMRERADEFGVLLRAAFDAEQDLRADIGQIKNRIGTLTTAKSDGGHSLPTDDARVQAERAKLDLKTAELNRRLELTKGRGEQFQLLVRLVTNCEMWLRAGRPGGTQVVAFDGALPTVKEGTNILGAIEDRRRRLRELAAQRHSTECAPHPSAIIKQKQRAEIDALAELGKPDLTAMLEHGENEIGWAKEQLQVKILNSSEPLIGFVEQFAAKPTFVWAFRDQLLKMLDRECDAISDDNSALTDAQRQKSLATVNADYLACERIEAEYVWSLQAQGMAIAHRGDTDPRALLGIDLAVAKAPPPSDNGANTTKYVGAPR